MSLKSSRRGVESRAKPKQPQLLVPEEADAAENAMVIHGFEDDSDDCDLRCSQLKGAKEVEMCGCKLMFSGVVGALMH